jgi:predicted GNAT family acetyltransferase
VILISPAMLAVQGRGYARDPDLLAMLAVQERERSVIPICPRCSLCKRQCPVISPSRRYSLCNGNAP